MGRKSFLKSKKNPRTDFATLTLVIHLFGGKVHKVSLGSTVRSMVHSKTRTTEVARQSLVRMTLEVHHEYSPEVSPREPDTAFRVVAFKMHCRADRLAMLTWPCPGLWWHDHLENMAQAFQLAYFFQCFLFICIFKKPSFYVKIFPLKTKDL